MRFRMYVPAVINKHLYQSYFPVPGRQTECFGLQPAISALVEEQQKISLLLRMMAQLRGPCHVCRGCLRLRPLGSAIEPHLLDRERQPCALPSGGSFCFEHSDRHHT